MRLPIQPEAGGGEGGGAGGKHATTDDVALSNKYTLPVRWLSEGVSLFGDCCDRERNSLVVETNAPFSWKKASCQSEPDVNSMGTKSTRRGEATTLNAAPVLNVGARGGKAIAWCEASATSKKEPVEAGALWRGMG
jgi:hypothetical protein